MAEAEGVTMNVACECGHRYTVLVEQDETETVELVCPACLHSCIILFAGFDAWDIEPLHHCNLTIPGEKEVELVED